MKRTSHSRAAPDRETAHDQGSKRRVDAKTYRASPARQKRGNRDSGAAFELDRAGRIRRINEAGASLLGFPSGWLRGKSFLVFVARQDVDRFLRLLLKSASTRSSYVVIIDLHAARNNTLPVKVSLSTRFHGMMITHRLTVDSAMFLDTNSFAEHDLANWKAVLHCASDILMMVDSEGRICFVNKPAWGYSVKALRGTHLLDQVPGEERSRVQTCLRRAFRFNRSVSCEIAGVAGRETAWFLFTIGAPGEQDANRQANAVKLTTVSIRDITQTKRLTDSLRYSREQLSSLAGRLEATREDERRQLARELHDDLGQALTVLKLELSMTLHKLAGKLEIRNLVTTMLDHVDGMLERVQNISLELRPMIMLDELGLLPAIEWQASEFSKRTGIRTNVVSGTDVPGVPLEISRAAFRVVQEALTNVMRHADASRVEIRIDRSQNGLAVSIADNGKGMTHAQEMHFKSLGIVGMRERVERLHGDFRILSHPGKGTQVRLFIPTQKDQMHLPFE